MKRKLVPILIAALLVALGLFAWSGTNSGGNPSPEDTAKAIGSATAESSTTKRDQKTPSTNKSTTSSTKKSSSGSTIRAPRLRTVALSALPRPAQETWKLVERGGPFPYDRDGVTFENREGLLPSQKRGYYREYTVPTPGEEDRGARRLVVGTAGDVFYTDDHYDSFAQVVLAT